jgi:hypothetical protein
LRRPENSRVAFFRKARRPLPTPKPGAALFFKNDTKESRPQLRVVAIENFHPPGLARPIVPGEELEVDEDIASGWLGLGFVRRMDEPAEDAMRRPQETPATSAKEKAILRPRENAARRKR